jgi:ribosomal protein S6--L-glutamate ligase
LLCFGKLETIRHLVPKKVRRRRRPEVQDLPELPVANQVHEHLSEHPTPTKQEPPSQWEEKSFGA